MTLIELAFFSLQVWAGVECSKAFASDSVPSKILFYLIGHLSAFTALAFGGRILDARRWFLQEFPFCEKGRCHRRKDFVLADRSVPGILIYRCRCGDMYARAGDEMYRVDGAGTRLPFARLNKRAFFIKWERVDSR